MRYWSLFLSASVPVFGLLSGSAIAKETINPTLQLAQASPIEENSSLNDPFWLQAQELIWEQLQILQLFEQGMRPSPGESVNIARSPANAQQLQTAREQLYVHLLKVERFLRAGNFLPQLACQDRPVPSPTLSSSRQQVYCALYYAAEQLEPFVPDLDRSMPLFSEVELAATPSPTTQLPRSFGFSVGGPLNLPSLPSEAPEPTLIGQPAKQPEVGDNAPRWGLVPNTEAIYAIATSRRLLVAARSLFPAATAPATTPGTLSYARLYPAEAQRYQEVLEQPNTGIATISATSASPLDLNQLRNSLLPVASSENLPLVPLNSLAEGFIPRLALRLEGNEITIASTPLIYGFLVDVGDRDLENFSEIAEIDELSEVEREFFLNYRPPEELRAIQTDQRRFFFGKLGIEGLEDARPPVVAYAPAKLNHTYVLRLIQYQLPEVILKDEPIHRARRRFTDRILETPSSDLSIVLRPIRKDADGSYVVLWKILDRFPEPEITDLEQYVDFQ
ncbi:hypothetical protein [Lusitaniella coriacea]|uniref:hypothetical protein n=1 Tax=Lusitaniella coriacea TaxID=1983105 RepID=UPI003CED0C1C